MLGCPKNEADSDVVKSILIQKGHDVVKEIENADVAIINTCAFISDAKRESIKEIFDVIKYGKTKRLKIIVHGCLAQRYFDDLKSQIPEVDAWLGVVSPEKIANAVDNFEDFHDNPKPIYGFLGRTLGDSSYAYVKIGDGCDRKCAFCAIPLIKGPLENRKYTDILKEIDFLVKNGKKEIILVSQDSTGYFYEGKNLINLLDEIDGINGDFWVRLLYLYPDGLSDELIETIAKSKKILHYFDIPIQHASQRILKLMRRNPDLSLLKDKIGYIKTLMPDAVFRTSFIVGFPSENDEDFEILLDFVKEMKFDRVGTFFYSDEEHTSAHDLTPKVGKRVSRERVEKLMNLQREINLEKNEALIGRKMKVLIEEMENGLYTGRTFMDAPEIDGMTHFSSLKNFKIGEFANVIVKSCEFYDLEGEAI